MKGKIKKWLQNYGFIETDELDEDVFVHESEIEGDASEGLELEFEVEKSRKGPKATNVSKVE